MNAVDAGRFVGGSVRGDRPKSAGPSKSLRTEAAGVPGSIEVREGSLWIRIKVQPRASRNEVVGVLGDELRVRVAAPPVDDAANAMLIKYMAQLLQVPRSGLRLVRGRTSAHKVIEVTGATVVEAHQRLGLGG